MHSDSGCVCVSVFVPTALSIARRKNGGGCGSAAEGEASDAMRDVRTRCVTC